VLKRGPVEFPKKQRGGEEGEQEKTSLKRMGQEGKDRQWMKRQRRNGGAEG